jgi:hypothetical protein
MLKLKNNKHSLRLCGGTSLNEGGRRFLFFVSLSEGDVVATTGGVIVHYDRGSLPLVKAEYRAMVGKIY